MSSGPVRPFISVKFSPAGRTFSFLLPVVGWFIFPLWVLISGLGALLLSWREQARQRYSPGQATLAAEQASSALPPIATQPAFAPANQSVG